MEEQFQITLQDASFVSFRYFLQKPLPQLSLFNQNILKITASNVSLEFFFNNKTNSNTNANNKISLKIKPF